MLPLSFARNPNYDYDASRRFPSQRLRNTEGICKRKHRDCANSVTPGYIRETNSVDSRESAAIEMKRSLDHSLDHQLIFNRPRDRWEIKRDTPIASLSPLLKIARAISYSRLDLDRERNSPGVASF